MEFDHTYDLTEFTTKNRVLSPENIILHYISNPEVDDVFSAEAVVDLLKQYGFSAHYLIDRSGIVYELVPALMVAWHAGKSYYNKTYGLNHNSIGIELIGNDDVEFTDAQYESVANLCANLIGRFNSIKTKNIKGHQIVSDSKVRKDPKPDPGRMFDWVRFGYTLITRL